MPAAISKLIPPSRGTVQGGGQQGGGPVGGPGGPMPAYASIVKKTKTEEKINTGRSFLNISNTVVTQIYIIYTVKLLKKYKHLRVALCCAWGHAFYITFAPL